MHLQVNAADDMCGAVGNYCEPMPRPDRRPLIADAAVELAASGGTHALTHQALDRHLGLPKGSTSYYFRTRDALLDAASDRLIEKSRDAFGARIAGHDPVIDVITDYVVELVGERRGDVLARQALLLEPGLAEETRDRLSRCFFSVEGARSVMAAHGATAPKVAADELITILEGIVFAHTQGVHAHESARGRRRAIRDLLAGIYPRFAGADR